MPSIVLTLFNAYLASVFTFVTWPMGKAPDVRLCLKGNRGHDKPDCTRCSSADLTKLLQVLQPRDLSSYIFIYTIYYITYYVLYILTDASHVHEPSARPHSRILERRPLPELFRCSALFCKSLASGRLLSFLPAMKQPTVSASNRLRRPGAMCCDPRTTLHIPLPPDVALRSQHHPCLADGKGAKRTTTVKDVDHGSAKSTARSPKQPPWTSLTNSDDKDAFLQTIPDH